MVANDYPAPTARFSIWREAARWHGRSVPAIRTSWPSSISPRREMTVSLQDSSPRTIIAREPVLARLLRGYRPPDGARPAGRRAGSTRSSRPSASSGSLRSEARDPAIVRGAWRGDAQMSRARNQPQFASGRVTGVAYFWIPSARGTSCHAPRHDAIGPGACALLVRRARPSRAGEDESSGGTPCGRAGERVNEIRLNSRQPERHESRPVFKGPTRTP